MEENTFLYTIPQWIIFIGIISIAYGWIEKKKIFTLLGLGVFTLLGIFALYAISNGYFAFKEFLTPNEIVSQELEEDVLDELPLQAKLLPAYWMFIVSGILSIPSFFLALKNKKTTRLFLIVTVLVALSGFFIVVGAIR
jgi:hypothetical protein